MNGIVFYIGLGAGLAAACGLRPFLPLLLAGALGTSDVLGVDFVGHSFHFLQAGWWLLAVTVAMVLSYAAQILLKLAPVFDTSRRPGSSDPLAAALAGLALGAGAALFGGTLAAHGDAAWPGIVGGIAVAALAQRAFWPVIARARARLPDAASREAATIYLDSAALLLAALVALLHPLGYVAIAAIAWFAWRGRSRGDEKYAGLRILGR
jgi:Domain of unknown function (DUF4126)